MTDNKVEKENQRPSSLFTGKPSPYTKEYIYEVNTSDHRTPFSPADHGFSYEANKRENASPIPSDGPEMSPESKQAKKGLAFTYAPPENELNSQNVVSQEDNRALDVSSEWCDTTIDESIKWDDSKEEEMVRNKENLEKTSSEKQHKPKLGISLFKKKDPDDKTREEKDKKVSEVPNKRDSAIETDLQIDEIVVSNIKSNESPLSEEEKAVKDEAEKENKLKYAFAKKSKSKETVDDSNAKKKLKDEAKKSKDSLSEEKRKEKEAREESKRREKEEKEAAKKKAKEDKKLKEKEAKEKKKAEKMKKKSSSKLDKAAKEALPEKSPSKELSEKDDENLDDEASKKKDSETKDATPKKIKSKENVHKESSKPKKLKLSLSKIVKKSKKEDADKENRSESSLSSSSSEDSMIEYDANIENSQVPGGLVTSTPNQSVRITDKFVPESSKDVSFSSETAVLELDGSPYSSPSSKPRSQAKDPKPQSEVDKSF